MSPVRSQLRVLLALACTALFVVGPFGLLHQISLSGGDHDARPVSVTTTLDSWFLDAPAVNEYAASNATEFRGDPSVPSGPLLVERPYRDVATGDRRTCYRVLSVQDARGRWKKAEADPAATPVDGWRRSADPVFPAMAPGPGVNVRGPGPVMPRLNQQRPLPPTGFPLSVAAAIPTPERPTRPPPARQRTLVVYVFSNTDSNYYDNLLAFLHMGVQDSDRVEYLIVLNLDNDAASMLDLPCLPSNARFLVHRNVCMDFGTFGWLLETRRVDVDRFTHFVVLNSSLRGPFFPRYVGLLPPTGSGEGKWHWTDAFTALIDDRVKLVGATASCERMEWPAFDWTPAGVHIQSPVYGIDQQTLKQLVASRVYNCFSLYYETVKYSEIAMSRVVLDLGWQVQSLMTQYGHVDWFDPRYFRCNAGRNPSEVGYRGLELNPHEVMFVKYKDRLAAKFKSLQQLGDDWERRQAERPKPRLVPVDEEQEQEQAAAVTSSRAVRQDAEDGATAAARRRRRPGVLVVYSHLLYSTTTPDRLTTPNFDFFVQQTGSHFQDVDATFVVLYSLARGTRPSFKRSSTNAGVKVLYRHIECKRDNPLLWALQHLVPTHQDHLDQFLWLQSNMRGPYLPLYATPPPQQVGPEAEPPVRWMDLFTSLLTEETLMVGSTIRCSRLPPTVPRASNRTSSPAVQTMAFAFSGKAVGVWREQGLVGNWSCQDDPFAGQLELWETLLSLSVLEKGYQIDSLQTAYDSVDWRNPAASQCNGLLDPTVHGHRAFELNPFEVMFIRVEESLLHAANVRWARLYNSLKLHGSPETGDFFGRFYGGAK